MVQSLNFSCFCGTSTSFLKPSILLILYRDVSARLFYMRKYVETVFRGVNFLLIRDPS